MYNVSVDLMLELSLDIFNELVSLLFLLLLLVHGVCTKMYCCCHYYTVSAPKYTIIAASTRWVHINVLMSSIYNVCTVGAQTYE